MTTGGRCMIDVERNISVFVMDADNAGLQIAPKTRLNERLNARVVTVVAEMIDGGGRIRGPVVHVRLGHRIINKARSQG